MRREGDRLIGENTDGRGFLHCVRESGVDPRGKRIALLGAGGVARAITVEPAPARAAELAVINRSVELGRTLAADLKSRAQAKARFQPWNATFTIGPEVDVWVDATSIGLYPDIDAEPAVELKSAQSDLPVCDVIPNPPETRLVRAARAQGLNTVTGLPMLVYQGAIGFRMWTCQPVPEGPMKRALEQAFGLTV